MENITQSIRNQRRPKGYVSSITTNYIHLRNPYVVAWWSAALPGLGHMMLGQYVKGFPLILWEYIINVNTHLNTAIIFSFTGRFHQADDILDKRWLLLYVPVYIYAIWDSYRSTVDLNKYSILADHEKSPLIPSKISSLAINFLDKRNPWNTVFWSAFNPGLGHLCVRRIPTGFLLLAWWIVTIYFSRVLESVHLLAHGNFGLATSVLNPDWLLFIPSLLGFAVYDSYVNAVEYNKLFEIEQSKFLKDNYQKTGFLDTLVSERNGVPDTA